jgi:PAS domain S-box-containing protein
MDDFSKTKKQLVKELVDRRKEVDELENDRIERKKREHVLLLTKASVDRAADAIFWMGPDARFIYVNEEACRSLGYLREELLSMTVHDIDPNFPANLWPEHWDDVKHRGSFTLESRHRTKDGRIFPVEITVNYLKFNGMEYNCAFARNITERKEAEEKLTKEKYFSETVINSLPGIFYLVDDEGRFHNWNKNAETVTGYSAEEIEGMKSIEFFEGEDKKLIAEKSQEVFDKGVSFAEADLVLKNGRKIRYYFTGHRLTIDNKQYLAGMGMDISDLKKTHDALLLARREWENIFQAIGHPTIILDTDHHIIAANRATVTATGKELKDIIGGKCFELFHGSSEPPEGCPFEKMLLSGSLETEVMEVKAFEGIYLVSCTPVLDNEDRLQKVIHIATDITDRKRAEEALDYSEERYRQLVENAPTGIYYSDFEGNFVYGNKKAEEIVGYKKEELIGKNFLTLNLLDPEEIFKAAKLLDMNKYGQSTGPDEFTLNRKDGSRAVVEISCQIITIKAERLIMGMVQDITERKKAEEAFINEKHKLEEITSYVNCGLMLLDNQTKIVYANRVLEKWFGPFYQIEGKTCYEIFGTEDPEQECACLQTLRTGESVCTDEFVISTDGKAMCLNIITFPVKDSAGNIDQITVVVIDITERKQKEEELKKFKFISDNANDAHFLVGGDGKFQYVNETACRMMGYSEEELLTMAVPDIDLVYDMEKYRELFDLIQKEPLPPIHTVNKRKNGTVFCSEISVTGYWIEDKPYMFAVLRDITERREAEEQIRKSLKAKELLLKEVHHRVKNNLTVIHSLLKLQSQYVEEERYREMFNDSMGRIKSMATIHEKLYRSEDLAKINFSDYMSDMADSLYQSYGLSPGKVTLKKDVEKVTLGIDASIPCGLIVNELVSNALKYAFPEDRKGEIKLSLRMKSSDEIELKVSDNGVGIPEGLDYRKADTLGLNLVRDLVGQLGGIMELHREKGTEFKITFRKRN